LPIPVLSNFEISIISISNYCISTAIECISTATRLIPTAYGPISIKVNHLIQISDSQLQGFQLLTNIPERKLSTPLTGVLIHAAIMQALVVSATS
jgi:hypothetical protein